MMRVFAAWLLLASIAAAQSIVPLPFVGDRTKHAATVAELANVRGLRDGDLIVTAGYATAGDGGGNIYRYVAASAATVNGGFVINGPGGSGRFLALDQTFADLRQFGAVGDGTTDDTAAVQAACDSGAAEVIATGGAFAVEDVTLSTDGQTIDLRGGTLKLLPQTTGEYAAILIQQCQNLTVRNVTFDGNKAAHVGTHWADAFLNGSNQGRAARCAIRNDSFAVAYDGLTVDGCQFRDMYGGCVVCQDASNIRVTNCESTNCNFETLYATGPDVTIEDVELSYCRILDTGSGDGSVNGNASIFTNVTGLRIAGNYVDGVERNAWKVGSTGQTITDAAILGNIVRDVTVANFGAMTVQDATTNLTIANNVFSGCDLGINIEQPGVSHFGLQIVDNTIVCTGTGSTGDGIRISSHLSGARIAGNVIKNFNRYGIRLQSPTDASETSGVQIADNKLSSPNAELALYFQATTATISYVVERNHIYGMEGVTSLGRIRLEVDGSDTYFHRNVRFLDNVVDEDLTTRRSVWCAEPGAFAGECVFSNNRFGGAVLMCNPASGVDSLPVRWDQTNVVGGTATVPPAVALNGAYVSVDDQSADPAAPTSGLTLWQSDGTGTGDDGDVMLSVNDGSTTHTNVLYDFSADAFAGGGGGGLTEADLDDVTSGVEIGWVGSTDLVDNGDGGLIVRDSTNTALLTLDSSGNLTLAGNLTAANVIANDTLGGSFIAIGELPADPTEPSNGFTMWQSDGTGTGDNGDIIVAVNDGTTTHTNVLYDFSADAFAGGGGGLTEADLDDVTSGVEIGWVGSTDLVDNGDGGLIVRDSTDNPTLQLSSAGVLTTTAGITAGGNVGVTGSVTATSVVKGAFFEGSEQAGDPAAPSAAFRLWQSNGTGTGDDGDLMVAVHDGSTAQTAKLFDFSSQTAGGVKSLTLLPVAPAADVATGDGAQYFWVPGSLDGAVITTVHAQVITAGTTGTTDVQIARIRSATPVDVLSTKLTIDSGETGSDTAATPAVLDASNDDLATGDLLRVDIDAVSTTAPQGLIITIEVTQ